MEKTYLTMVEALSSIMERSWLAYDDCRPVVTSSIFLSSNGKDNDFSFGVGVGVMSCYDQ
jgi:hypothetical protein